MNQGLAVILPMLFFAVLDLVIVYNVYKYKNDAATRAIFLLMSAANFVQQLCGAISYLFDYQIVSVPAQLQYVLYLCLFTAMAITSFEWFMYLRLLLSGKKNLSKGIKFLLAVPVASLFCMTLISPWTHWIVWIRADGVYQRGTLGFLQFVCTYIYVVLAIAALICYRKLSTSVYRKKVYGNFFMFILPAIIGTALQLKVFDGGYTMIGISLAVILLYLDLYVDEINENQKLQMEALEQKQHLQELQEEKLEQEKKKAQETTVLLVQTLSSTIEARNEYLRGHSARVSEYSVLIARKIGLSGEETERIRMAATLHDLGKINVPDAILNKPSRLTDEEYQIIKNHCKIGSDILKDISVISYTSDIARHHHERYDGKGYPDGLKGEEISLGARIVAVADSFDAMNSKRVYRAPLDRETIRNEILNGRGSQFDPVIADAFMELYDSGVIDKVQI